MRGGITRLYLTKEHRRAADIVAGWMRDAGLDVTEDGLGTVFGRLPSAGERLGANVARRLLIGSHIDTVIDAGAYDGMLGVVAGHPRRRAHRARREARCHSASTSRLRRRRRVALSRDACSARTPSPGPSTVPRSTSNRRTASRLRNALIAYGKDRRRRHDQPLSARRGARLCGGAYRAGARARGDGRERWGS